MSEEYERLVKEFNQETKKLHDEFMEKIRLSLPADTPPDERKKLIDDAEAQWESTTNQIVVDEVDKLVADDTNHR